MPMDVGTACTSLLYFEKFLTDTELLTELNIHVLLTYMHAGGSPANVCDKECLSSPELLCRYFNLLCNRHIYTERETENLLYITYTDCDIHAVHVGQKRSRCGHCAGCHRDNCGSFKARPFT